MDLAKIRDIARDKEKISLFFNKISKKDAFKLVDEILSEPLIFEYPLQEILLRYFSDNEEYIGLFIKIMEKTIPTGATAHIFEPIKSTAIKNIDTLKKIIEKTSSSGASILLPWISESEPEYSISFIKKLHNSGKKEDVLNSYLLIRICLYQNSFKKHNILLDFLATIKKPDDEDLLVALFWALNSAYWHDKKRFSPVLKKFISENIILTQAYLNCRFFKRDVELIKFCIKLINGKEGMEKSVINGLLSLIDDNPTLVFEVIELWLRKSSFPIRPEADFLLKEIRKKHKDSFQNLFDRLLDEKIPFVIYLGTNILYDAFYGDWDELIEFIKDWIGQDHKEKVMVSSLRKILSNYLENDPYQDSIVKNKCVELTRTLAKIHDVDYEKVGKTIDLSKEKKQGWQNKQEACRASKVLKIIAEPVRDIDITILKNNLKNFPNVQQAFNDYGWMVNNLTRFHAHYLCYIYSNRIPKEKEIKKIKKELEGTDDKNEKFRLSIKLNSLITISRECHYWEIIFQKIHENGIKFPKQKMKNIEEDLDILSEVEIAAILADSYSVEPEPKIQSIDPKILDFKIKKDTYEFIIEVARCKPYIMDEISTTPHKSDTGKIKKVILNKLRKQFENGKKDPKLPVLLFINITDSYNGQYEVMDAIYGQQTIYWKTIKDTGVTVEEGISAKENSIFEEKGSDLISGIVAYSRNFLRKNIVEGRMYTLFPIKPKNPLNKKYSIELRNTFLRSGDKSEIDTLLKIDEIDKKSAKILYDSGIEDIGILASIELDSFKIPDFSKDTLEEWQKEAQRIVTLINTSSIRFLKDIDEKAIMNLNKENIFTIHQLLNNTSEIKGISNEKMNNLKRESKSILENKYDKKTK